MAHRPIPSHLGMSRMHSIQHISIGIRDSKCMNRWQKTLSKVQPINKCGSAYTKHMHISIKSEQNHACVTWSFLSLTPGRFVLLRALRLDDVWDEENGYYVAGTLLFPLSTRGFVPSPNHPESDGDSSMGCHGWHEHWGPNEVQTRSKRGSNKVQRMARPGAPYLMRLMRHVSSWVPSANAPAVRTFTS